MNRKLLALALGLALVAVLGIVSLLSRGGPKDYALDRYERVSQDGDSYVLRSPRSVSETAAEIRGAWKPAQELTDPAGVFLRYSDLVVAVTPDPDRDGSTVYLDDERRGYAHWFPYVGGFWGSPGVGGVGGVRGGGPGAGK
ncbi:MAG: DUF4247 domain-containing protein [Mycobacteriales bacterium]|nr:DUF4247 domain-containing protein [Mycobacteriales bacterium]